MVDILINNKKSRTEHYNCYRYGESATLVTTNGTISSHSLGIVYA